MRQTDLGAHGDERNGGTEASLASARPQAGYPAAIFHPAAKRRSCTGQAAALQTSAAGFYCSGALRDLLYS